MKHWDTSPPSPRHPADRPAARDHGSGPTTWNPCIRTGIGGCVRISAVGCRDDRGWAGVGEEFEQVVSFGLDVGEGGLQLVDVAEPLLGAGGVDAFGDVGLDLLQTWQLGWLDLLEGAAQALLTELTP